MGEGALVVGLGVAGEAAARQLARRGWDVVVAEDAPGERSRAFDESLGALGVRTVWAPDGGALEALVDGVDLVVPSPPVPRDHPAVQRALARGIPVWSEFELAARWSSIPMVAITGTDGKTTVTALVEAMLRASGLRTVAAGNNDLPLVDALDDDLDVVVVEASSFRLAFTETFAPAVGVWLNLAEDHLDWHPTMKDYGLSKARIWAWQGADDVAVANAEDEAVLAHATGIRSRLVTFGLGRGDARLEGGHLVLPGGEELLEAGDLWRALPHDLTNALAAAVAALAAGATVGGARTALCRFRGLPHRITLVGEHGGVRYYDDSKATVPHATLAAVGGFERVVLVAGGRNKGTDLSVLGRLAPRLRGVVAIGEAAEEVAAAFPPATSGVPVVRAASMDAAVAAARDLARPGDAVVLSPGCASYDWYGSYRERGDDFVRAVVESTGMVRR